MTWPTFIYPSDDVKKKPKPDTKKSKAKPKTKTKKKSFWNK